MAKDKDTAERRAMDAMLLAKGALLAFREDGNGVQDVIVRLDAAIAAFDPRCDHEWVGGSCKKCGVVRRVP